MRARLLALSLLLIVAGCTGKDAPPRPDSLPPDTTVVTDTATDTAAVVDTGTADTVAIEPLDSLPSQAEPDYEATAEDTLAAPPRGIRRATMAGLVVGLSGWHDWCGSPFSGAPIAARPRLAAGLLRAAHRCNARIVLVFPRDLITANGQKIGRFSETNHRRLTDDLARALPADTLRKYASNGTLHYFSVLDDLNSREQWAGGTISLATAAKVTCYAQQKLGVAFIGIRQTAAQLAAYRSWNNCLDVTVAAWHKKKGDQQQYYDKARNAMGAIGVDHQIYSINVHDCAGGGSSPCTPNELRTFGRRALSQPNSYGFIAWKLDNYTLTGDYRNAWTELAAFARTQSQ